MESKTYKCLEDYVMYDGRTAFIEGKEYSFIENIGKSEIHDIHDMQDETEFYRYFKQIHEPTLTNETPIQSPDADNTERGESEKESVEKILKGNHWDGLNYESVKIDFDDKEADLVKLISESGNDRLMETFLEWQNIRNYLNENFVKHLENLVSDSNPTPPTLLNELRENADDYNEEINPDWKGDQDDPNRWKGW